MTAYFGKFTPPKKAPFFFLIAHLMTHYFVQNPTPNAPCLHSSVCTLPVTFILHCLYLIYIHFFPNQAKRAFERLNIPRMYHPFICGPDNKFIKDLMARTGAQINVPPPSVQKDEIVVSGEKDGVHEAIQVIMGTYEDKVKANEMVQLKLGSG